MVQVSNLSTHHQRRPYLGPKCILAEGPGPYMGPLRTRYQEAEGLADSKFMK